MTHIKILIMISCMVLIASDCFPLDAARSDPAIQKREGKEALLNRIDFGNSYIMGQTVKSGAIYLLQRKKSEIESLLEYRTDYRKEILEDFKIYDTSNKESDSK